MRQWSLRNCRSSELELRQKADQRMRKEPEAGRRPFCEAESDSNEPACRSNICPSSSEGTQLRWGRYRGQMSMEQESIPSDFKRICLQIPMKSLGNRYLPIDICPRTCPFLEPGMSSRNESESSKRFGFRAADHMSDVERSSTERMIRRADLRRNK